MMDVKQWASLKKTVGNLIQIIMNTYTEKISDNLNALLEKTYDAEKGFHTAAENTEHAGLKRYFERKSKERYNFGHELKSEITSFGGDIDNVIVFHRLIQILKNIFSEIGCICICHKSHLLICTL